MSSLSPSEKNAPEFWRSLEEFSQDPSFQPFLEREFPQGAAFLEDPVSRRHFLQTMSASIALAGLTGCRMPKEEILPYVKDPEGVIPGKPQYFASTLSVGMHAYGVVLESHQTRPTKVEGNELHVSTLGASSLALQASVLDLYNTERLEFPKHKGDRKSWSDVQAAVAELRKVHGAKKGQGLAILSGAFASPTLLRLRSDLLRDLPQARWVTYEPFFAENNQSVLRQATGQASYASYDLRAADCVVSVGEDFLGQHPDQIRLTREFTQRRQVEATKLQMNRLYVLEAPMTLTGGMADHRFKIPVSHYGTVVVLLAKALQSMGLRLELKLPLIEGEIPTFSWINEVAKDLLSHQGSALLAVGPHAPDYAHAVALAVNVALGSLGKTLHVKDASFASLPEREALYDLDALIRQGQIESLVILDSNPVYTAPSDIDVKAWFSKLSRSVCLTLESNESSALCEWELPLSHPFESWGDAQSVDGQISPVQPLIRPLFESQSVLSTVALLQSGELKDSYALVRDTWRAAWGLSSFEGRWAQFLRDGALSVPARFLTPTLSRLSAWIPTKIEWVAPTAGALDLVWQVCPKLADGRFASNAWLQECPDPLHKITYDNPVLIGVETAKRLNVSSGQVVTLTLAGKSLSLPVFVQPGQAEDTLLLTLGYGREVCGHAGKAVGVNAYPLRSQNNRYVARGASLAVGSGITALASTQSHWSMEGRAIIRKGTLDQFKADPHFARKAVEHLPLRSLWKEHDYSKGYQWGMVIDLNACTGCSACVIACQSENNIPVVGKEQVLNQREMHWIRVDRYFEGDPADPELVFQPMTCQQCENAPCEQVCPVNATVHDQEGLNAMVYNRCIGTRYCSNNCPYKVRRFNFFNYTGDTPELKKMQHNPNVTVRSRGVMEKCTFCVQRINEKKLEVKQAQRELQDGELQTACQQACPASAIHFGNLTDANSNIVKQRNGDRAYELLSELNTKPRNSFLAKLKNPNPALHKSDQHATHGGHA